MDLLLGIDIGTTGCKASLFDTNGRLKCTSYREYKIMSPNIGWAEEDPEEWWSKTAQAVRESIEKLGVDAKNILSVGVSCTNGLIPVDKNGNPVTNAIMQIDGRAVKEVSWISDVIGEERVFSITGNRIAPGTFSAPTILWIKNNMPEDFKRIYKFLVPAGFVVHKLTGKFSIDYTRASTTLLFDIRKKEWSEKLCREMGIPLSMLPELSPPDAVAGRVTKDVSRGTGLIEGTPVAVGIMDTAAAAIGMGVTEPDNPFLIMGTVGRISMGLSEDKFDKRFLNACFLSGLPWIAMAPTNGCGISLRWFKESFGEAESIVSANIGVSTYQIFDIEASKIKPGSDGLIYLPYIAGERSPIWDSAARGVFFGISPSHRKAHFARAIMEGVAYATRHNMEIIENELGIRFDSVRIGGGGAQSLLWREIMAHMLGKKIIKPRIVETETMGSAVIAGKAAGVFKDYSILKNIIEIECQSEYKQEIKDEYDRYFELYKMLYIHLKDDFKLLQSILERNLN